MSLNDAMLHPTVVMIIEGLDESVRKLREELATARADEREACIKLVNEGTGEPTHTKLLFIVKKERKRIADLINARGTT